MDVKRAGRHAAQRMTTGYILPIEPTRRRWKPWMAYPLALFAFCLMVANPEWGLFRVGEYGMLAMIAVPFYYFLFYRAPKAIKNTAAPLVREGWQDLNEGLHSIGWPTWRDAWGYRGHRPGGAFRACLRGYLRVYVLGMGFLLVAAILSHEGENMAVVVVYGVLGGVPAILAAGWLYQFRCHDFDPAKGLAFGVGFWALLRMTIFSNRFAGRQPYQSMQPSFTQPPGLNTQPSWNGPKPPWM